MRVASGVKGIGRAVMGRAVMGRAVGCWVGLGEVVRRVEGEAGTGVRP